MISFFFKFFKIDVNYKYKEKTGYGFKNLMDIHVIFKLDSS